MVSCFLFTQASGNKISRMDSKSVIMLYRTLRCPSAPESTEHRPGNCDREGGQAPYHYRQLID